MSNQKPISETTLQVNGKTVTVRVVPATSYRPNPDNTNKGKERGSAALEKSLEMTGFHRGIFTAADGTIVGGNHAWEAATAKGVIDTCIEIETQGDIGVVTKRIDWASAQDPQAIAAAISDNRTSELNFDPDAEAFARAIAAMAEHDMELPAVLYTEAELLELLNSDELPADNDWASAFGGLPDGDRAPFQQMTFTLHDEQVEQVKAALEDAKRMGDFDSPNENSNGNALARICESFLSYGKS